MSLLLLLGAALAAPHAPTLTPDARGAIAPERTFDVERLHLDLDLSLDGTVSGTATVQVRRLWPGPLVLHQVDLDIASVRADGIDSQWWIEGDRLLVEVDGDQAQVAVTYSARPDTGLHVRRAERGGPDRYDEIWSQGEGEWHRFWFPSWDYPNDRFVYEGDIRGPDGLQVITNSGQELVNYLVMVAIGPYEAHAHPADPSLVTYVPPGTSQAAVDRVLEPLPAMMAHFAARTGLAYPFGPYRQVFVQRFMYGAMENTSASTFGARFLADDSVGETRPYIEGIVAHELAHQWFGDWLTCRTWRELWLNEGFATFLAADWFGEAGGPESYAERIDRAFDRASGGGPMARRFHAGADAAENSHVYVRGAATLHMLRVMLGEDAFWAGIQRYVAGHGPGLVETDDLRRALEDGTGRHLDWFFQQWVELSHTPKLKVSRHFSEGTLTVSVDQVPTPGKPLYTLPITIEVGHADGTIGRVSGWLEDEDAELTLAMDAAPAWVAFDPDRAALADVTHEQTPEAWAAQLQQSPSPFARRDALAALGETDQPDALVAWATDSTRPLQERRAAIQALGAQRHATPLLPPLTDPHGAIREASAEALGHCTGEAAVAALVRATRRDANSDVRAAALTAMAKLRPDAAVREARAATRLTRSEDLTLRSAALTVLGEHGAPTDLGAMLDDKGPAWMPRDGLRAAAKLVARQAPGPARDRMAARAARFGDALLTDRGVRTRQAAVAVLGEVGDDASIAALEAYRRAASEPGEQRAAQAAVRSIRARSAAPPETPNATDARFRDLEERLDALEAQTHALEDRM